MALNTVIFDMDGLLIDSEPCWQEAGMETLLEFQVTLTPVQYHHTTGLRTREWLDYWFGHFGIRKERIPAAEGALPHHVIGKIKNQAHTRPGVHEIIAFFRSRGFRIGLATSSPLSLVTVVVEKLGIVG